MARRPVAAHPSRMGRRETGLRGNSERGSGLRTVGAMKTDSLRYGIGVVGAISVVLACGETEKDSAASGTDDSSVGGSDASGGSGDNATGPTTVGNTSNVSNASNAVTNAAASVSGTVGTASSVGGSPSSTSSFTSIGGAGGLGGSNTTTSSSVGGAGGVGAAAGAGGAGGAPAITECLGCETSTEPFGEGCQVWVCYGPGEGIQRLIDAGCEDLATQVPRYCCPPDVELDCD